MDQISYSPRQIKRGMSISIWAAVLWSFYAAFVGGPILPGLELALGFSPQQCALINSMGNIFLPLQLVGLYVQERFFHRTRYWGTISYLMFTFFGLLGVLSNYYSGFTPAMGFLLFALTYAGVVVCSSLIGPIGLTWHADFIPKRASNAFWSKRQGMYMLFSMFSGILSGILLDRLGAKDVRSYTYMLLLGMVFGYASSFIQTKIPDPNPFPRKDRENPFTLFKEALKHKTFRTITLFFSLQSAGSWISAAFTSIYLLQTMNMNMKTLQILAVIAAAISFAASYFFQIVGTKYGRKPVLVLCTILISVQFLIYAMLLPGNTMFDEFGNAVLRRLCLFLGLPGWQLPPGVISVLPVYLVAGVTGVGVAAAQQSLLTSQGDRRIQGSAIALFYSITGVCGALTGIASGWLYKFLENLDVQAHTGVHPFNIMAFLSAMVYIASLFLIRKLHEDGAVNAFKMMRVLVTENSIRQVVQSYTLGRPLSEETRVNKLQNLRGSMVTDDLVADLYSPSSRVRDEAVNHLSNLDKATPEAIAELLKIATDTDLGMRVPALRALGRLKAREVLPTAALLAMETEPAVAQSAVFALGMISDPSSAPVLRALLKDEKYNFLHAAAAEALSRIGFDKDAELLYNAYATEFNPTLTMQTLLALCRLWYVPESEDVYRIFDAEMRSPGEMLDAQFKEFSAPALWTGVTPPPADEMTAMLDGNNLAGAARRVIEKLLEFKAIPLPKDGDLTQLVNRGPRWKNPPFDADTVILALLVGLWSDIANRPDEQFDRPRLLCILCGAKNILTRHDRDRESK